MFFTLVETRKKGLDKKTSPLWQYFTSIDSIVAICNLCSKEIRYHCSTSNLRTHLSRKHPDKIGNIEQEKLEDEFAQTIEFDALTSGNAGKWKCHVVRDIVLNWKFITYVVLGF